LRLFLSGGDLAHHPEFEFAAEDPAFDSHLSLLLFVE
jgi:hypothetical protein